MISFCHVFPRSQSIFDFFCFIWDQRKLKNSKSHHRQFPFQFSHSNQTSSGMTNSIVYRYNPFVWDNEIKRSWCELINWFIFLKFIVSIKRTIAFKVLTFHSLATRLLGALDFYWSTVNYIFNYNLNHNIMICYRRNHNAANRHIGWRVKETIRPNKKYCKRIGNDVNM